MNGRVLVLGSIPRIMLAVARSLGRFGIAAELASEWPQPFVSRSRYVRCVHQLPAYSDDPRCWLTALTDLLGDGEFDCLFTCGDWENLLCHTHREELSSRVKLAIPDPRCVEMLMDKLASSELARGLGIRVPRQFVVENADVSCSIEWTFPLILKPRRSFDLRFPATWQRVVTVHSADEYVDQLARMGQSGDVLVQEHVAGESVGVELLLDAGEPVMAFQHERIHQPHGGGPSSYRRSVEVSDSLYEASTRLLGQLGYTGVAMVEFLVDPRGEEVFLEVNPRFWGSLPLAVAARADFPAALYRVAMGKTDDVTIEPYRRNLFCRNLTLDVQWYKSESSAGRISFAGYLSELLGNVISNRERNDLLTIDDPLPGLWEAARVLRNL